MKRKLLLILPLILILTILIVSRFFYFSGADDNQVTITIQPGAEGADATIRSAVPDATDPNGHLGVGQGMGGGMNPIWRSLIKFDLNLIPSSANITEAVFSLYVFDDNTFVFSSLPSNPINLEVNQINAPWEENAVTWSNQPPSSSLGLSQAVTAEGGWYNLDLTNLVKTWLASSNENYGLAIKAQNEDNPPNLWLINSSDDSTNQPKLTITYSLPQAPPPAPEPPPAPPADTPPPPAPEPPPAPPADTPPPNILETEEFDTDQNQDPNTAPQDETNYDQTSNPPTSSSLTVQNNEQAADQPSPIDLSDDQTRIVVQPKKSPMPTDRLATLSQRSSLASALLTAGSLVLASNLFGSLLEQILLILHRFIAYLLSLFQIKKLHNKGRGKGLVLASESGQPIEKALVTIKDLQTGKEIWQELTDQFGRFSFNLEKEATGEISVVAAGYQEIKSRFRGNQAFVIRLRQRIVTTDHAIHSQVSLCYLTYFANLIRKPILAIGTVSWLVSAIFNRASSLIILLGIFYVLSWFLEMLYLDRPKLIGKVGFNKRFKSLAALILVKRENSSSVIERVRTKKDGSFVLSLPEGQYDLTVQAPGFLAKNIFGLLIQDKQFNLNPISLEPLKA